MREAIADVYDLDAARIVCGAGSDELIGLLIHAYAGDGGEVLYSEHGFLMYKIYALACGAIPVTAPETNLRTDVDALLAAVTDKTKIVFVANPNNPTGSYVTAEALQRLRDGLPEHVLLAVDAAYSEYVEQDDYSNGLALAQSIPNTVMLRTFSKIYGIPSLRLGWAYAPEAIVDVLHRVRSPFNVSGVAQAAGVAAVRDQAFVERSRKHNSHWLAELPRQLSTFGLHPYPSVGNFVLVAFPDGAEQTASALSFLAERGILVRDTIPYGLSECLRITIGTDEENAALLNALSEFMAQ